MLMAIAKSLLGKAAEPAQPTNAEASDEELMLRYAGGDLTAFETLVKRHERQLFHYIRRSCQRPELAEELLQETFLRVIRYSDSYKPTAKFTTWVYTIARNLCIDRARRQRGPAEVSLNAAPGGDPEAPALIERLADPQARASNVDYQRQAFRQRLLDALDQLPEEQREVFVLREFSGLKFHEIAQAVGCKVPTVKSRMRYALEALRGHLAEYIDHSFDQEEARELTILD